MVDPRDGRLLLGQREQHDLEMIVDPITEQPAHLRDQPPARRPRAPAQQPEHHRLEHAGGQRRSGELLQIGSELERERQQQREPEHGGREIQLEVGGEVRLDPATPGAPGERLAPLADEGRVGRDPLVAAQADLSFTRTLSLRRPVTGRWFFFW